MLLTSLLAALMGGCTLEKTEAPELAGPSELGLSLALSADPSTLKQDGASQSRITITARGPNAEPIPNVKMHAEILVGGAAFDFGRLSTRSPVTSGDGRAVVTYTAPAAGEPVDNFTIVTIFITPAEGNHRNAQARSVDLRLVPMGIIQPPNQPSNLVFNISPTNPTTFSDVIFDATSTTDPDGIASYRWDFGDGSSRSGMRVTYQYELAGDFLVTLTVTDKRGNVTRSEPVGVTVQSGDAPVASFTITPISASTGEKVFFNASASRAGAGREIKKYQWNLGTSDSLPTGVIVSKTYDVEGVYTITLTVTDDVGQKGTLSQQLSVGEGGPGGVSAEFNFSPSNPTPGSTVFFDGSPSTSPRDITKFFWNFGDGTSGTGQFANHLYNIAGSYGVTLTITDSSGRQDQNTQTVVVQEPEEEPEEPEEP